MEAEEFNRRKEQFIFSYFLQQFAEENKSNFKDVYIYDIYPKLLEDKNLVYQLMLFIAKKMYLITLADEAEKLKELFISELN